MISCTCRACGFVSSARSIRALGAAIIEHYLYCRIHWPLRGLL